MGRPPEGPKARDAQILVRLTPEERKQFDLQRGNRSRAQYVRDLVEKDGKKRQDG